MKKITQEQKQEIIRLRVEEKVPAKAIAEKFHLSKSAVFNIVGEWKKQLNIDKKPDTVAAVSDSEQEIVCENIPADIIPDISENVKADDDLLPCAVVDAIADKIDMLYDEITECDREMQKIRDARENAESGLKELKAFLRKYGLGDVLRRWI